MSSQTKANEAIELWQALSVMLKEELDEADKALSNNEQRAALIGHLDAVKKAEDEVQVLWKEVAAYRGNTSVEISFVPLMLAMKKQEARCAKLKGHLKAQTELAITATTNSSVVQVLQPTSFGSLVLPDFSGDYTAFDGFEGL